MTSPAKSSEPFLPHVTSSTGVDEYGYDYVEVTVQYRFGPRFEIMERAWLLFLNHQVSNAAREGARYAVVNGEMSGNVIDSSDTQERILDRVYLANGDSLETDLVLMDGNMEPERRIWVAVDYAHQPMIGFIVTIATINLGPISTMRGHS